MVDGIERETEPECNDRRSGRWRVVVSAWALVILLMVLSAGAHALASRHNVATQQPNLVGVVIPRHDPACARIPTDVCTGFKLDIGANGAQRIPALVSADHSPRPRISELSSPSRGANFAKGGRAPPKDSGSPTSDKSGFPVHR